MKAYHDVHIHNYLSSCSNDSGATVERYIEGARQLGLKLMGFANHTWDESIPFPAPSGFYSRQSMAFQMQIKAQIPQDVPGIKVLVGAETEYCGMYDVLGMGKEAAEQLDFLLIPHTHVHMRGFVMPANPDFAVARRALAERLSTAEGITPEYAALLASKAPEDSLGPFMPAERFDFVGFTADFMVKSLRSLLENESLNSYADRLPVSVAHPFQPVNFGKLRHAMLERISSNTFGELFETVAARGIGLEINPHTGNDDDFRMFSIAKECGCKFTLGSDMHTRAEAPDIFKTEVLTARLGLTEYDLMDFVRV